MKPIVILALVMALASCSSSNSDETTTNNVITDAGQDVAEQVVLETDLPLPSVSAQASCDYIPEFTGGDLKQSLKRIVVGTVTSIDVAPFKNGATVCPRGASLTLVVKMDVEENLWGQGETVEFYLDARDIPVGFWSSRPRHRMSDGTWVGSLPNSKTPPPARVTQSLGWTDKFGIYPGERLLVMLYDNEEFEWGNSALAPGFFPLAKGEEDGTFVFQEMTNNFLCIDLPQAFRGTTSLEAIRAELQKPANEATDRGPHYPVLDFSECWGEPTPSVPEFNDAGTD